MRFLAFFRFLWRGWCRQGFGSGGVLADIGRQDLHDGPVVFLRVPGDAFQGADAPQALDGLISISVEFFLQGYHDVKPVEIEADEE